MVSSSICFLQMYVELHLGTRPFVLTWTLLQILRREGPPADALERLRVLQRDGLDYHLESEWHHWILLEGRKRFVP